MKRKLNENNNYYNYNSGISLIVLVITIIVIIILAAAVILTLTNNNPISEANKARYESDRANMQSIFTSTVSKVMAQKQTSIKIQAGQLNSVKSGVSSTTGVANYTLEGVEDSSKASGTIEFDNKENGENKYYTGKQLPIYKTGETTWSVDEDGILKLQVGKNEYTGNGENGENGSSSGTTDEDNVLISKEEYDALIGRLDSLESELKNNTVKKEEFNRKTTMKTLSKNVGSISFNKEVHAKVTSITIPEDCYAYIQGRVSTISRDSTLNNYYYCISIFVNGVNILYNGGIGNLDSDISCSYALKKGDVVDLTMYYQAPSSIAFTGNMTINYFPKN